jgi:predicted PurR-regulated permease PerM
MHREVARQLLTFLIALFGALLGSVIGRWFDVQSLPPRIAIALALALFIAIFILMLYLIDNARRIERRVKRFGRQIDRRVIEASEMSASFDARDLGSNERLEEVLRWRERIEKELKAALPGSGADTRYRVGVDELIVGNVKAETLLTHLKANLMAIRDALTSYVMNSSR